MTFIRVTCAECSLDCELPADDMLVVIRDCGTGHYYVFTCPYCAQVSRRHAEPVIINLLVTHGVPAHQMHVPKEVIEIEKIDAPAISPDEVLDFIGGLRGWMGEVA